MKKILLTGRKNSSVRVNTKDEAEIIEKLTDLKLQGANLDDFDVMEIDTERQPPVQRTAAEWLELRKPPAPALEAKNEKNALIKMIDTCRNTLHNFFKAD